MKSQTQTKIHFVLACIKEEKKKTYLLRTTTTKMNDVTRKILNHKDWAKKKNCTRKDSHKLKAGWGLNFQRKTENSI